MCDVSVGGEGGALLMCIECVLCILGSEPDSLCELTKKK